MGIYSLLQQKLQLYHVIFTYKYKYLGYILSFKMPYAQYQ